MVGTLRAANGIKSKIGNYKDNRFHALFQTSAEVFLHKADFIKVFEILKAPNLKLRSVLEDRPGRRQYHGRCAVFRVVLCEVTGPYWSLITDSDVSFLELFHEVNAVHKYLINIKGDPAVILQSMKIWDDVSIAYEKTFNASLEVISDCGTRNLLFKIVSYVPNHRKAAE